MSEASNNTDKKSNENALNFLSSKRSESEATPKEVLGFVPLDNNEKNRAVKLYEEYQKDETHGVARYLSYIARSRGGKGSAAMASVFRSELIAPYKESIKHQDILEATLRNAPELGSTLFEDEGYDDPARDVVADYVQARQEFNGADRDERITLSELMRVATKEEVVELVEEVYSNAVLRENFWHRIIDSARDPSRFLDKIAKEANILRLDPAKDVQETDYRRGTIEDPEVNRKRRESDKPY